MSVPAVRLGVIFAAYFVTGLIGLEFATTNASATPVWAPSGIAVAAVLLYGRTVWPAIWAAAFLVNVTNGSALLTSAGIASGNTLEALAALFVLTWIWPIMGRRFRPGHDTAVFAVTAVTVTVVSATIGPLTLVATTPLTVEGLWPVAFTWWLGDTLGVLLLAPVILLSVNRHTPLPWFALAAVALTVAAGITGSIILVCVLAAVTLATVIYVGGPE